MPIINPTLPNDGEDADAADVSAPIQAILAVLNGNIDDENIADEAIILSKLASAVTDKLVPSGIIVPYGGASAPSSGWLLCAGQAVSRTTYSALFAIIGTSYGVGDGSTTFNLPDLRGRVLAGIDNLGGTAANRLQKSTTISTTSGSASATVASATGLYVGQYIFSTNVPAGTTISAISGTTVTMSQNATATAAGTAARFSAVNDPQSIGGAGGDGYHYHPLSNLGGVPFYLDSDETQVNRNGPTPASNAYTNRQTGVAWSGSGTGLNTSLGLIGQTDNGSAVQATVTSNFIIKT